jgi:hypothetical protein
MATGAPGTNGVWQYGEDDSEATFSALLNKAASTTDTAIGLDRERLDDLEAKPLSGLIPVVPSSVVIATGSGSANAIGEINFTGATTVNVNGVFTSDYSKYRILFSGNGSSSPIEILFRWRASGVDKIINYYGGATWSTYNSGPTAIGQRNNSNNAFVVPVAAGTTSHAQLEVSTIGTAYSFTSSIYSTFYSGGGAGGYEAPATGTDGFTFFVGTGNFTGKIQVFGYNN